MDSVRRLDAASRLFRDRDQGPTTFKEKLPIAPQRAQWWKLLDVDLYEDVAVYAFLSTQTSIEDPDQKACYRCTDFMHGSPAFLSGLGTPAHDAAAQAIKPVTILDLTKQLRADGTLEWSVPAGKWTVLRFGSRSNGTSNRPALLPVVGLDHDKFHRPPSRCRA